MRATKIGVCGVSGVCFIPTRQTVSSPRPGTRSDAQASARDSSRVAAETDPLNPANPYRRWEWGPFSPDIDETEPRARLPGLCAFVPLSGGHTEWRWKAAAEAQHVKSDAYALRTRFGCLFHGGSVPKRQSYRGRRGVDGKCPILSVIVGAVFTRAQPCVEVVWEAPVHPHPQHIRGGMIVIFEIPGLCRGFSNVNARLFLFSHGTASSLIFAAQKELYNLGDQAIDDVHWGIPSGQRWTRPVVEDNASRRASNPEALSSPAELRARLCSLNQTARLLIGTRGAEFCHWLAKAETDPAALEPAYRAFNALAATARRQIPASYAALTRPA